MGDDETTNRSSTTPGESTNSSNITAYEGLTYAERRQGALKLDLYVPQTESDPPLLVYFHGGGWIAGTRKEDTAMLRRLAETGYAVATVDYRLSEIPDGMEPALEPDPDNPTPRATFPAQILDTKASVRWLRANAGQYGYDADQVAVWGTSAGSHLAALTATVDDVTDVAGDVYTDEQTTPTVATEQSGTVQAAMLWFTPTDFLRMQDQFEREGVSGVISHNAANSPESLLLGGQITENEAKVERANPITYVDEGTPPMQMMHGLQDRVVPYLQDVILYESLQDAGVDATLYLLHELGHEFFFDDLITDPTIKQTVRVTHTHTSDTSISGDLVAGRAPAGPEAMTDFLARTIHD
nr:alpha/beta hydrolase [Halarchaeum rubridurum]